MTTAERASCASARDRERGAATVLLVAVVAVALILAVGAVALAHAAHARGTAQAAADLAAIAAAQAAQRPGSDPCAVASRVVAANDARLQGCAFEADGHVQVTVVVAVEPVKGWRTTATAAARAGPVR
ncbi:Rv3654c family TadE-like protein [Pseudactinotalea sp.]|uniref:Rv3654c family TadE-like protein n=1 Tax=Pseudactinotalea sp. TaxID=1926260 RepID=UPI003B3B2B3E